MLTSHIAPVDGHQMRLRLDRSTIARLIDLRAQAVAAGIQKPSYSVADGLAPLLSAEEPVASSAP